MTPYSHHLDFVLCVYADLSEFVVYSMEEAREGVMSSLGDLLTS